jgi:PhzF family phenazine biosynthesis protein
MVAAMSHHFHLVDVFTDRAYHGNPLAVVMGADHVTTEQMQRFANWMNLSETTFLLSPSVEGAANGAHYRVRIFTPAVELPFAGHPTLGTCQVWLDIGHGDDGARVEGDVIVQECGVGLVPIRIHGDRLSFRAPPLVRSGPLPSPDVERLACRLGLDPNQVVDAAWVDNGPGWVGLLLPDAEAVLAIDGVAVDDKIGVVGAYLGVVGPYPTAGEQAGVDSGKPAFEIRAFFPSKGATIEDPVTGSLNASMAQWLIGTGRASPPYLVSQGTALGRSGRVFVTQDDDGEIWIGGHVTRCGSGTVAL